MSSEGTWSRRSPAQWREQSCERLQPVHEPLRPGSIYLKAYFHGFLSWIVLQQVRSFRTIREILMYGRAEFTCGPDAPGEAGSRVRGGFSLRGSSRGAARCRGRLGKPATGSAAVGRALAAVPRNCLTVSGGARHGLGGALRGAGICLRHCSEGFSRFLQSGFRPGRCRHLRKLKEETPASRAMGRRCGEWGPGGWYRRGSAGSSCLTAAGGTPALGLPISPADSREDPSGRTMLRAVQREREAGEGRGRAGLASVVQPPALTPV